MTVEEALKILDNQVVWRLYSGDEIQALERDRPPARKYYLGYRYTAEAEIYPVGWAEVGKAYITTVKADGQTAAEVITQLASFVKKYRDDTIE